MKKFVLSLALLLSIPNAMVFADCSPELAAQIVEVNFAVAMKHLDRMYDGIFDQMFTSMVQRSNIANQSALLESIKPELAELSTLSSDLVKELLQNKKAALTRCVQQTTQDESEAQELLRMLQSPVMQRFQEKLPEMTAAMMPTADEMANLQAKVSSVIAKIETKVAAATNKAMTRSGEAVTAATETACDCSAACTKACDDSSACCSTTCAADEAERGKITCSCSKPKPAKKDEDAAAA